MGLFKYQLLIQLYLNVREKARREFDNRRKSFLYYKAIQTYYEERKQEDLSTWTLETVMMWNTPSFSIVNL